MRFRDLKGLTCYAVDEDGNITDIVTDPSIDNATDCSDSGDYGGVWLSVQTTVEVNGDDPSNDSIISSYYGFGSLMGTQIGDGEFIPSELPLTNQDYMNAIAKALPTVCSAGVFVYSGHEGSLGVAHGFAGTITEYDSKAGFTQGALFEGAGGEGIVGGVGYIVAGNPIEGLGSSALVFGGAGIETPIAEGSVGLMGSTAGPGVYGDAALFGYEAGVGGYLSITPAAACHP